jgi:hypothetical protein
MYSSDWIVRNCPGCQASNYGSEPEVESPTRAELYSFEEVKQFFIGLRREQVFFSYHRCRNCGLLYCPRYFSEVQLDILYSEMPDNLMGEDKGTISKTQSGYVKWATRYLKSVKKFVEVGPDIGLVTNSVINRFHPVEVGLIEPNHSVRQELFDNAKKVELVRIVDTLSQLKMKDVDFIVGVHVYYHLLNEIEELNMLNSISSADSKLLIVVHNEKSALRELLKEKWPPFCLQHPQLYNPITLGNLLEKAGWKLETVSKSTNWWRISHFIRLGLGILGLSSSWTRLLPKFEIPIRLGNMIALANRTNIPSFKR